MVLMSKIKGIFHKEYKNKLAASVVLKDMKELKRCLIIQKLEARLF